MSLCARYSVSCDECRNWYDGCRQHGLEIYNPESVVKCMRCRRFDNYWGKTSAYTVITDRIHSNFEHTRDDVVRMMAGEDVEVSVTGFLNTMTDFHTKNDVLTYLIHTGYFAYNLDNRTCRIQNKEIRGEWVNAIAIEPGCSVTTRIIKDAEALVKETFAGNEAAVAKALDISHINVTRNRGYNNEDALQSAIYLAYIYALNDYTVVKEMTAGKGVADLTCIPVKREGHPAIIIELKRNHSAESALSQIRKKQYFASLSHYYGDLFFVGISYDEQTKTHTCRIEKFRKD